MSKPRLRKRKPVSRLDLAKLARKDEMLADIMERLDRMRRHHQDRAQAQEAFGDAARYPEA